MGKSELTKRALSQAFRDLLETSAFEQITVSAIARTCGVNRQTFYYHFRDLYDLIEWSVNDRIGSALIDKRTFGDWQEEIASVLGVLREERDLVFKLRHSIDAGYLQRFLHEEAGKLVSGFVTTACPKACLTEEEHMIVSRFYAAGLVDAALAWVDGGMREEPKEMVDKFALILREDVSGSIARFAAV